MFFPCIPRNDRQPGTGWRYLIRSTAYSLLLFIFLNGTSAGAAESSYRLVGTVESEDFTGAVIIEADGKQTFYRLREILPDGAELVKVHSKSISLKGSDGSRYDMFITAAGKLETVSAPSASVFTPPQAQPPADKGQRSQSPRRRSRQPSSRGE